MNYSRIALWIALVIASGCSPPAKKHSTEEQVLAVAEHAMKAESGELFEKHRPYRATLTDGIWTVRGTSAPNLDGGGVPEAYIEDGSGNVIKIVYSQ
jgi:hypothetical protein